MKIFETKIETIFDGNRKSYIYIWFSKVHRVIYIGMTNQRVGTLGRAKEHFQPNPIGTLRKRFYENRGYDIENVEDFTLFSFELPSERMFFSEETSYREAVEFLVQDKIRKESINFFPSIQIISKVRPNDRTSNKRIIRLANKIFNKFKQLVTQSITA